MIIVYMLIGLVSGVISGMGIGGGTILIPALIILFEIPQQQAQNANLIYFIPTAIIALRSHLKQGNIEKKVVKNLILYGVAGAVAGSVIAVKMEPVLLKKCFGLFLLVMGVYEVMKTENTYKKKRR